MFGHSRGCHILLWYGVPLLAIQGPFNLGHYGVLVGWISVLWVATISVLFSLLVAYPITDQTLNYTLPVAVGGLLIIIVSAWVFSARHWFTGPITNISTEKEW